MKILVIGLLSLSIVISIELIRSILFMASGASTAVAFVLAVFLFTGIYFTGNCIQKYFEGVSLWKKKEGDK